MEVENNGLVIVESLAKLLRKKSVIPVKTKLQKNAKKNHLRRYCGAGAIS
jgi:hypothetical protein